MTTAIGSYATAGALKELIGTTDSDDDERVADICDRVNAWIESITRQPVCPIAEDTYTYDANGLRHIYLPMPVDGPTLGIGGAREVTLVEIAPYSSGTYANVAETDYVLRSRHGVIGPYRWLRLSNKPVGTYRTFPEGISTVRVTMTAGWDAIPDDLTMTALLVAHRAWNARQTGDQSAGQGSAGEAVSLFASRDDLRVVRSYKARPIP